MTWFRILHVDDDPDIRDVVALSLGLDPVFSVRSCASGKDALAAATEWSPDMILCDVIMPVMDGPAMLARLRESPQTVNIPVVFMTARAQTGEIEQAKSLGAIGVILKPFNPMTLADAVRCHLRAAKLTAARGGFVRRMHAEAAILAECGASLKKDATSPQALEQIKTSAHALAGTAGIFNFQKVSCTASVLEETAIDRLAGNGAPGRVESELDALLYCIDCG